MRIVRAFVVASLLGSVAAALADDADTKKLVEKLTPKNFQKLQAYIAPKPDELLWQKIPWRTALAEAVQEAKGADRPLLLFAMNGHPCGHT